MAAKPTFSKEQLNFFKFSTLVLDEFPKVLRQIFITKWDSKVAIRPGFIVWDDSSLVRNMLLTSEGGKTIIPTTKSIEEWDCTALFKATIYAKTFGVPGSTLNDLYLKKSKPAPGSFHSSVQSSTGNQDETYALAIDQLRLLRNTLCHSPKSEIVKRDFDNYVKLVNDALTAVNVDTAFVDVIGKMSEDDFPTEKVKELEEFLARELRAISMFRENVEQTLSSVKECGEKTYQYTEEIHTMVKREHGNRRNEERQPTRSCLPEKLPKEMFTARNAEMQKVVSFLNDKKIAIVSLIGGPGFGKTAIAVEVSHKLSNDHKIPVVFSDVSRATTVDEIILLLCRDVGINHDDDPKSSLHFWLKNIKEKVIFVLDDIDNLLLKKADFYDFIRLLRKNSNQHCQIVTTSRTSYTIPELSTAKVQVNEMDDEACVELLRKNCPKQDDNFLQKLAKLCGSIPLAMCIAGSRLDDFEHSGELLQYLEKEPMKTLECSERNQYVYRAINMSYEMLNDEEKEIFVRLAVFEGSFSEDAAEKVIEKGKLDTTRILKDLVSRSLIKQPTKHRYSIHLLIKHCLIAQAESEEKRAAKERAEVLMVGYYLKLGNYLTIKSYSKDGYKENREALKKEAHNIQNVLKICCQQKDSTSEISNCIIDSKIYTTPSSRYFSLFVRTIVPDSTVDEFLQCCAKLAEEKEQHAIKISFDCLLADQERIKSIGKPACELFSTKMMAIEKEFEMHHEEVKEDKSICAHYYYQYGRYLSRKSENYEDEARLVLLKDALKRHEKSLDLRTELADTSVEEADKIYSLSQLGKILTIIASTEWFRKEKEACEKSTIEAQEYLEEAIRLSKSGLGEHDLTSSCYKYLGDLLRNSKNYKKAEENYRIAKKMRKDLGLHVSERHVSLLDKLGSCLTRINHAEKAIELLKSALDMADKLPDKGESTSKRIKKVRKSLEFAHSKSMSRTTSINWRSDR